MELTFLLLSICPSYSFSLLFPPLFLICMAPKNNMNKCTLTTISRSKHRNQTYSATVSSVLFSGPPLSSRRVLLHRPKTTVSISYKVCVGTAFPHCMIWMPNKLGAHFLCFLSQLSISYSKETNPEKLSKGLVLAWIILLTVIQRVFQITWHCLTSQTKFYWLTKESLLIFR